MSKTNLFQKLLRYKHIVISLILCIIGVLLFVIPQFDNESLNRVFYSLGATIFASGTFTTFYSLMVKTDFNNSLKNDLEKILKENYPSGIGKVHPQFPVPVFLDKLRSARKEVVIYQTIFPEVFQFIDELEMLLINKVEIKILLVSPESDYAEIRAMEQGHPKEFIVNSYKNHITIIKKKVQDLISKGKISKKQMELISLKNYDTRYAFSMYKIDDDVILGIFWNQHSMTNGPQIEIKSSSPLGESLIEHFNLIWGDKNITNVEQL